MKDIDQYSGVWVFVEFKENEIARGSLELLSIGRGLADELQVDLSALLMGDNLGEASKELIYYGADIIYTAENPILDRYTTSPYQKVVYDLIKENRPEIVLISSTDIGMDLAPRVACELETGLSAHCVDLKIDKSDGKLLQICPYFDHMATIVTDTRPQMATVQPGIASMPKRDESRQGKTVKVDFEIETTDIKIVEVTEKEEEDTEKIEEADVVVAVGRGMKEVKLAQELARKLGGVVGATQPVTDAGLLPESRMIGQTGKNVQPKLYVACGISGAGQHIAGMQNSEVIVAINTDEKAPIFKIADYGIVGDASKVIPAIIASMEE